MENNKIPTEMLRLRLAWVEEMACNNRRSETSIIKEVFGISQRFWFESESASLFWDGRQYSVNKMIDEESDFIIHEFDEVELDKAIEQFIEHSLNDQLGVSDEEALLANGESDS